MFLRLFKKFKHFSIFLMLHRRLRDYTQGRVRQRRKYLQLRDVTPIIFILLFFIVVAWTK